MKIEVFKPEKLIFFPNTQQSGKCGSNVAIERGRTSGSVRDLERLEFSGFKA